MRAGDVLLFDSLLPHGTAANSTEEHRWALQYHFCGASAEATRAGTAADAQAEKARLQAFGSEGKGAQC